MTITLEKIIKDLGSIEHELIMFCYHKMNNRDDEAQSYLDAYADASNSMIAEMSGDCKIYIPKPDDAIDDDDNASDVKEMIDDVFYDITPIPPTRPKRKTTNHRLTHPEDDCNEIIE
jgi:hypothetical protein